MLGSFMKNPITVTVTGAAGQIGYALLFRIASGAMFGPEQPVSLRLIEIEPALPALEGVVMELDDCAFPLLHEVVGTSDLDDGFNGANWALLVGSVPRKDGMERADLLEANGGIFGPQGSAISQNANSTIKVLVVGNPANTNALIAQSAAAGIDPSQFTAMTRLDHNRAKSQVSEKLGVPIEAVKKMTIWGNHSATQYPDLFHCEVEGKSVAETINDQEWLENEFIPTVQQRGAAIIKARGASSAASAANAAIDHMRDWALGTTEGDWVSMAIPSDGSYGIPEGVISSFPVTCSGGSYEVVQGLELDEFSRQKIDASAEELVTERETVSSLGLI